MANLFKFSNTFVGDALTNLLAQWGTLTMRLYQNNYTPAPGMALANFTEATFTGYSAQAIVQNGSVAIVSNQAVQADDQVTFQQTGTATTNTIYGYFVTATDPVTSTEKVVGARLFDSPITMDASGSEILVTPSQVFFSTN